MGQDKVVIPLEQDQLLVHVVFALPCRGTAPSHHRHLVPAARPADGWHQAPLHGDLWAALAMPRQACMADRLWCSLRQTPPRLPLRVSFYLPMASTSHTA